MKTNKRSLIIPDKVQNKINERFQSNRSTLLNMKRTRAVVFASLLFALTGNGTPGAMLNIGPPEQIASIGTALNDNGEVAGTYITSAGANSAFLYSAGITKDLGILGLPAGTDVQGHVSFVPAAINNRGEVAGNMTGGIIEGRGFLYRNSKFTDLGALDPQLCYYTYVADMNDLGQVVGSSQGYSCAFYPFLYEGGVMKYLAGGFGGGEATAVNNRGDVVGRGFIYSGGIMADLQAWISPIAVDVNESGEVAGWFVTPLENLSAYSHAFFYDGKVMKDIGTLGGLNSMAVGINNAGEVVGWSEVAGDSGLHGFIYRGGAMIDIGSPDPLSPFFTVSAINDAGQVLGQSYCIVDLGWAQLITPKRAFLYSNGRWNDLGTLGGSFTEIGGLSTHRGDGRRGHPRAALNNSGQVVGSSQTADGEYHAFIWTPGFADDGIIWHQPLARPGANEDTDPSEGGTLKYRFKPGSTIPVKVHALGFAGNDITSNPIVTGKVEVFPATGCDTVADGNALPIENNGIGGVGGAMNKVNGHLTYNLDTKQFPAGAQCFILKVTVTDGSTGESISETVPLSAK